MRFGIRGFINRGFFFRRSAVLLALVAGDGLPGATHAAEPDAANVQSDPVLRDLETTGSVDRSASSPSLPLSDEQRGLVFLGVIQLPDVPVIDAPAPEGVAILPESVALQELPAMVVRMVPLMRDHKFAMFEDRILVVRPIDRVVVAEIPIYRLMQ
jgi:hypothetical protein